MGRYIVRHDVENRVSPQVVREIFDDDTDGEPDKGAVERAIADAESRVESYLRKTGYLETLRVVAADDRDNVPNEVKRLCLDLVEARMWERFPEYVRADGAKLYDRVTDELRDLARGITRLDDIDTVEPTRQVTVEARSGDSDDPTPVDPTFNTPGAFGDF
jgi:phage gp36-like protein